MAETLTATERAMLVVGIIGDAIKELGSVPSGHLYARVMEYLSLEAYQNVITILKRQGKVKESGHLLTWIGK